MSVHNSMTKELFLLGMSCIYLFAFASLYIQIPGLYGDNGLLPARLVLKSEPSSLQDFIAEQPSLLRFAPKFGLSAQHAMDLVALIGTGISFLTVVHRGYRNMTAYVLLWALYFSLYQVGQTFLWFQWDILLLETGILTVLVAPLNLRLWKWETPRDNHHDNVTMYLVKWLLFRLMFASGVVKLTSECAEWWGLTAMDWHYESQCIPTPLAWYFHQLPHWFQAFSTCMVYVIEIVLPFLFFSPMQGLRIFSFYSQILLMILIMLTGNYNFFNLLTMVLNISLLDDRYLRSFTTSRKLREDKTISSAGVGVCSLSNLWRCVKHCITVIVYTSLAWFTVKYFNLHFREDWSGIHSKIGFSKAQFYRWLDWILPVTMYIGTAGLIWSILTAFYRSFKEKRNSRRFVAVLGCLVMSILAVAMFAVSLVPHTSFSNKVQNTLPRPVKHYYKLTLPYEITHSYGLFRSMTGVGGRPEVVVEGSDHVDRGWKEYEFVYKPGNVSRPLPFVAPHQPRLDWQMWFAALGSYQHNHWFVNLAYRLLQNQPAVLALIEKNPFPDKPPKYVRASLYTYRFTRMDRKHEFHSTSDWWQRKYKSEYLPVLSLDEPSLTSYLRHVGLVQDDDYYKSPPANKLSATLDGVRDFLAAMEGCTLCISLLTTAVVSNRLVSLLGL